MEDRRKQGRIELADSNVVVKSPRGTHIAKLCDLALGSAKVELDGFVPAVNEELGIFIFSRVDLVGTVVRVEPTAAGCVAAIRFRPPPPATRQRLIDFLSVVLQYSQDGQRRHPRLSHRLEIGLRQGERAHMAAVLHDVSHGGVLVALDAPVDNSAIEVHLPHDGSTLVLHGRVMRQWQSTDAEKPCFASVAFDDVSADHAERLAQFLEKHL